MYSWGTKVSKVTEKPSSLPIQRMQMDGLREVAECPMTILRPKRAVEEVIPRPFPLAVHNALSTLGNRRLVPLRPVSSYQGADDARGDDLALPCNQ